MMIGFNLNGGALKSGFPGNPDGYLSKVFNSMTGSVVN